MKKCVRQRNMETRVQIAREKTSIKLFEVDDEVLRTFSECETATRYRVLTLLGSLFDFIHIRFKVQFSACNKCVHFTEKLFGTCSDSSKFCVLATTEI